MSDSPISISSPQSNTTSNEKPISDVAHTLDNAKAIYYLFNTKPDTDIRLLKGNKIITIGDIRFLNDQINKKLENYLEYGCTTVINLVFDKNKIKEYASWYEFDRENWNSINEVTISLSMSWDFSILLPKHELPQRHSVKVRIGSSISPKDMFHLLMSSDDMSEIMEARSDGICKVDFINQMLANELLNIVNQWYEGLKENPNQIGFVQKRMKMHQSFLLYSLSIIIPLILLFFYVYYSPLLPIPHNIKELSVDNLQWVLFTLLSVYTIGKILSRKAAKWLDDKIDSYKSFSKFSITKGDENAINDISIKNKSVTKDIRIRLIWSIISAFIGIAIRYILEYYSKK